VRDGEAVSTLNPCADTSYRARERIMRKMLEGIRFYQANIFDRRYRLFSKLVQEQRPGALFITCCDSRIDPELLTGSDPGDIFVIRNAGSIVPPFGACDGAVGAEIELGISGLGIRHIVICGHTRCAAVKGILFPETVASLPTLSRWLRNAHTDLSEEELAANDRTIAAPLSAIERHVATQVENLKSHPAVSAAIGEGRLELHGWIYHLETGAVTCLESSQQQFMHFEAAYQSLLEEQVDTA
jgi:carbonic anhydrase